uniref:CoA transferase n=1 Tax=Phenylobacterium glaciei TaxID=2803784 RepID=A0A974P4J1_9CAUL|nr:CoA transferase [Phenylobacterium glaciei]
MIFQDPRNDGELRRDRHQATCGQGHRAARGHPHPGPDQRGVRRLRHPDAGDQGAEVIKLEDPGSGRGDGGDIMRWAGHVPEGTPRDLGPIFLTINRNKRSVLMDMRDPASRPLLEALIKSCDVFAVSVRYEGLKRLGLAYEDVKALRPDVVYVHASGYGSDGPYAGSRPMMT